jgi:polar amino acid transport system substrate-binding protein
MGMRALSGRSLKRSAVSRDTAKDPIMRLLKTLLACLLLAPVLTCLAAPPPMDVTLSNDEYPPYLSQNLPWYGLLSRVVTEAFALENVKVHYVFYPNNRCLESARTGLADGSLGWAVTPERLKDLKYTDPVMTLNMVFFQRSGRTIPWQKLSDLAPYRIGVTVGNTYSTEFDGLASSKVLHTESSSDDLASFRMLLANHVDLFPIDSEVGNMLLMGNFHPDQRDQMVAQTRAFWTAEVHVVIWRKLRKGDELIRRFNLGLQQLRKSGEYDRVLSETRKAIYLKMGLYG